MEKHKYLVLTELFLPTKGGTAVWFDEVYRRLGDRSTIVITEKVAGSDIHDKTHPNNICRVVLNESSWIKP